MLSVIWGIGFDVNTLDNRIVLASEIHAEEHYPADDAGLKTGARIIERNGEKTSYSHEVQENIAINPEKPLPLVVERDGEKLPLEITPSLDKSSGAGKIGVYFWTDPVIEAVSPESPAALAGLLPGDRIKSVNGRPISHSLDFLMELEREPAAVSLGYARNGEERQADLMLQYDDKGETDPGIVWASKQYRTPLLSPFAALAKGAGESWKTLVVSLRSLRLLFKGIDLTQAVSGPVRITYMVGDVAAQGFGQGFGAGVRSMADFLALISIALCVMNLLPLPILDGGMIVLFLIEMIRRKPTNPRAAAVFQTLGAVLIFGLMILAVFGDILYLARR